VTKEKEFYNIDTLPEYANTAPARCLETKKRYSKLKLLIFSHFQAS
jgi:hypothetical protein